MRLSGRTISDLAELICGASGGYAGFRWDNFVYRSSSQLTQFFRNCDLDYAHDGSTRKYWVEDVLNELNQGPVSAPQLPPDSIIRVIKELMDVVDFERSGLDREKALEDLNRVLERDGIEAYFDAADRCHIRNIDTRTTSAITKIQPRADSV